MKVQFYYLFGGRSLLHNSLLIYFTPLLVTSTCFPLFLTKPTFSGCAGITAFLPFAFLITFILHTFPNLLPISSFPPSSSQSSKNNLGPARSSEPDSCDAWALRAWAAAEGAGLGDLVRPQQLQGGGSRRRRAEAPLCSFIFRGWVSGSWGKYSSMYRS